jgi:hypothetical protein
MVTGATELTLTRRFAAGLEPAGLETFTTQFTEAAGIVELFEPLPKPGHEIVGADGTVLAVLMTISSDIGEETSGVEATRLSLAKALT